MINDQDCRKESPALEFKKYGIAVHFLGRYPDKDRSPNPSPDFSSFERDLMSYSFRLWPPFSSEVIRIPEDIRYIDIQFPPELVYTAEGKRKRLICTDLGSKSQRTRRVEIKASRTDFLSDISVFHLILCPEPESEESALNEYDLVKLVKLWEGGEEAGGASKGETLIDCIKFHFPAIEPVTIRELAGSVFGNVGLSSPDIRVGTIQLITEGDGCGNVSDWSSLWKALHSIHKRPLVDTATSEPALKGNINKAVLGIAGIFQGLLDFDYIDVSELRDVFGQVNLGTENLIGIHKGTLLNIASSDRAYEVIASTIGISPYLIIPHAVLLHNEELLRRASEAASKADSRKLKTLEDARREMHRLLDRDYLPNIFHYPTEKMLYEIGENSRGLTNFREAVHSRLSEVNSEWEAKTERRRRRAEDMIAGLLLVLSGLQIRDVISPHLLIPVLSIVAVIYILFRNRK